jgi:toxin ParE1/3/4
VAPRKWRVRLSEDAERDFREAIRWTNARFGASQVRRYTATLHAAINALKNGPTPIDGRSREDIAPGLRVLHAARQGHRARHFILYRVVGEQTIEVVRMLHDAMDLRTHFE